MKYNDKKQMEQTLNFMNQNYETYQSEILKLSDSVIKNSLPMETYQSQIKRKFIQPKGKQNEIQNSISQKHKNTTTNHSFNGFFNENTFRLKNQNNQSYEQSMCQDFANKNLNTNQINFTKIMQAHTANHAQYKYVDMMHSEVQSFIKKYFPDNYKTKQFYAQYVALNDFVDILFQQFQGIIGIHNNMHLVQTISDKIFEVFGDKIYFDHLFQKTFENGLTGLVFEIIKTIEKGQGVKSFSNINNSKKTSRKNLSPGNNPQTSNLKDSKLQNQFISSNINSKIYKQSQTFHHSYQDSQSSKLIKKNNMKISLDKIFGSSFSRVSQCQQSTQYLEDNNLIQLKQILQDYIQRMYEQAQSKIHKKYSAQMKKLTQKYKQTQKILQKVNQKISNHYDSIQLEKNYQKRIKTMIQKQNQLVGQIKSLEFEIKSSKDESNKQKNHNTKIQQEMDKIKQKLQKYQNAIFQKAMEKTAIDNKEKIMESSKQQNLTKNQTFSPYTSKVQNPKFQLKINTTTEHKPIFTQHRTTEQTRPIYVQYRPMKPLAPPTSYSPYISKRYNSNLTPTRVKQYERVSVSPIRQKISFVKAPSPTTGIKINQSGAGNQTPVNKKKEDSRVLMSNGLQDNQKERLQTSNVQRVQIGQKVELRPLSPIVKLGGQTNNVYQNNVYQQSFSPIRVQHCNSQFIQMPSWQ